MTAAEWLKERGHSVGDGLCEKCWTEAYMLSMENGRAQSENYYVVMADWQDRAETAAKEGKT